MPLPPECNRAPTATFRKVEVTPLSHTGVEWLRVEGYLELPLHPLDLVDPDLACGRGQKWHSDQRGDSTSNNGALIHHRFTPILDTWTV
jgi:hypothetical protein